MKSFHEAAPQMKVGDIFKTLGGEFYELKKHGSFKVKEQDPVILTAAIFNLSGEIIRAEPEVLTADQIYDEWAKNPNDFRSLDAINKAYKNGQIKEWKRMKPLVDEVKEIMLNYPGEFTKETHRAIQNLTPPWEPEK